MRINDDSWAGRRRGRPEGNEIGNGFSSTAGADQDETRLDLQGALEMLTRANASLPQVVAMHYVGGMTAEETAMASA